MLESMFVDFQLYRSSSSEVVFHGGSLPDFRNFQNCVGLFWTSPTNVTKHVLLISSYFTTSPDRWPGGRADAVEMENKANSAQLS